MKKKFDRSIENNGLINVIILNLMAKVAKDFGYSEDFVLNNFGEFMVCILASDKSNAQLHKNIDEIVKNNRFRFKNKKQTKKGKK